MLRCQKTEFGNNGFLEIIHSSQIALVFALGGLDSFDVSHPQQALYYFLAVNDDIKDSTLTTISVGGPEEWNTKWSEGGL